MKICVRCQKEKPLEDFHNCSTARDGYRNKCKACAKTIQIQRLRGYGNPEITALMDLWNSKKTPTEAGAKLEREGSSE